MLIAAFTGSFKQVQVFFHQFKSKKSRHNTKIPVQYKNPDAIRRNTAQCYCMDGVFSPIMLTLIKKWYTIITDVIKRR